MQASQPKTFAEVMCALGCLVLVVAACGSSDEEPADGFDAGTTGGGAPDGSSLGGSDAAPPGTDGAAHQTNDDAGTASSADGGQAGGSGADAGSSNLDGGTGSTDATVSAEAGSDAGLGLERFSFFVTSLSAMRQLSGSQDGFGGNLTFGETGEGAGLRGADKICTTIAETSMPGSGAKGWHAFLSTDAVDARDRIGSGPWYDRMGRPVAENLTDLLNERPVGADPTIQNDLPNERGEPNQAGSAEGSNDDNHDVVTGSDATGAHDGGNTCADWTSTTSPSGSMNGPRVGHSWFTGAGRSGRGWIASHRAPGCAPSVNLSAASGGGSGDGIGNGGGYGGIYCFALTP